MGDRLQKSADSFEKKSSEHPGILDPVNAAQRFRLARYLPSADLAPFVEHHWTIHWDLRGQPPYVSEVLPFPTVNVAFTDERGWVTGVTTGKYTYEVKDVGLIVGTMFRPGGFHAFWRRPVSELTDQVRPAVDVFPTGGDAFRTQMLAQTGDEARIAQVEDLLLAARPEADRNLGMITEVMQQVERDPELRTVDAVAQRVHLSGRTLQALFNKYVGVGLKWVLMRYRLVEAAELAARTPDPDWVTIALDLGYSHQSHFVNDFRKLIGKSPLQYVQAIHTAVPSQDD